MTNVGCVAGLLPAAGFLGLLVTVGLLVATVAGVFSIHLSDVLTVAGLTLGAFIASAVLDALIVMEGHLRALLPDEAERLPPPPSAPL